MLTLIRHVRGQTATFQYFRDGSLWYKTSTGLLFEVPVNEAGSATFNAEERAIFLMRYIRRQLGINTKAEKRQRQ